MLNQLGRWEHLSNLGKSGRILMKLCGIITICFSVIIFSAASAGAFCIDQNEWSWDEHYDQICVVEHSRLAFNTCEITGVDSSPGIYNKKVWAAISLPENILAGSWQAYCCSSSSGSKHMDANFSFTKNTADRLLYYFVDMDSPNSLKRSDLF